MAMGRSGTRPQATARPRAWPREIARSTAGMVDPSGARVRRARIAGCWPSAPASRRAASPSSRSSWSSRRRSGRSASGARSRPTAPVRTTSSWRTRSRRCCSARRSSSAGWWPGGAGPDNSTGRLMAGTGHPLRGRVLADGRRRLAAHRGRARLARRGRDVPAPDPGLPGRAHRCTAPTAGWSAWPTRSSSCVALAVPFVQPQPGRLRRVRRQPAGGGAERHGHDDRASAWPTSPSACA